MRGPIRILIVDDHAMVRNSQEWMQVIGEVPDGVAAVEMCRAESPSAAVAFLFLEMGLLPLKAIGNPKDAHSR